MDKLLEVSSLVKTYHNGREQVCVLDGVSFSVCSGEYISVLGPSGAGKSTLLHILGGLDSPDEGRVVFKGTDIHKMTDRNLSFWRNKNVGFVFQFYHLIEELTVLENVTLASSLNEKKTSAQKAYELLEYLDMLKRKNFYPSQLSGGEKQKTAVARALVNGPEMILCDEPTGNLDKESQVKVAEMIGKLNSEMHKTVVLVTHNIELAKKAGRILSLEDGKIK